MTEKTEKKKGKWLRRTLIGTGLVTVVGVPGLWVAINTFPSLGPALADGTRAVLGPGVIAWAEDVAYGVQDRIDRWRYKDDKPKTFWDAPTAGAPALAATSVPATVAKAAAAPGTTAAPAADEPAGFPPPPFSAPVASVAAPGDGSWIPIDDGSKEPIMAKAVVHPDPKRNFAAVAVVAVDLKRVDLHMVAGTQEPASDKVPADHRPGIVPREVFGDLVAAFNGGFKLMHGHYGMMLDGETFAPPRDVGCTVGLYKDGGVKIRTWQSMKETAGDMAGYRQTPPCLVEQGKVNDALESVEYNKNWGATVSGDTVIRRSAIGLDKDGHTLFYALGEACTAQALAHAMHAVGASSAAQLDVNYSYPRFLFYTKTDSADPPAVSSALIPGIKYQKHEYTGAPEARDFFYLTKKHPGSS